MKKVKKSDTTFTHLGGDAVETRDWQNQLLSLKDEGYPAAATMVLAITRL